MFFRPDQYSFFNYPIMCPAEIGVFDTDKKVSIGFDTTSAIKSGLQALFANRGTANSDDNSQTQPYSR